VFVCSVRHYGDSEVQGIRIKFWIIQLRHSGWSSGWARVLEVVQQIWARSFSFCDKRFVRLFDYFILLKRLILRHILSVGILCGWSVHLEMVSHWTFVPHAINFQKHAQDIFSYVLTLLTNCFAEYERRTLYGAPVVTLAMLLRLTNCHFINITVIILMLLATSRPTAQPVNSCVFRHNIEVYVCVRWVDFVQVFFSSPAALRPPSTTLTIPSCRSIQVGRIQL